MKQPKFTFIVACHETEPYLRRALDSVAGQTLGDFEAICYVEESKDRSLEICRSYAERDPRFTVAEGPVSGGVATTRNYGLDHAKGEYLVVLDGDDWVRGDMLETLAAKIDSAGGDLDVIAFAATRTRTDPPDPASAERLANFPPSAGEGVFTGADAIRRARPSMGWFGNFTWLNAYRTAFLRENGIRQTDGLLMEDVESTPRIWIAAKRFAYVDEELYVYRLRPGSITTAASLERANCDTMRQIRSLLEFAEARAIPGDIAAVWCNQWVALAYVQHFYPGFSKRLSDGSRRRSLGILFAGRGAELFSRAVARASRAKRIAYPFFRLAAKGWMAPARLFFRFYYALAERRRRG
ncbi:MAG: glycosyltransferase [Kiritimatiellae bacterium]|nr:glycosyltransferase [Kiritimatiellia bacterium]